MIRCRTKWATKCNQFFFDNRFLTRTYGQNTEKWRKFYMLKNIVFGLFRFYLKRKEQCDIDGFVPPTYGSLDF